MPGGHKDWTRDEHIMAFNLYCKIPFGRQHSRAPEVIALAKLLGRSPNSVALKLNNFSRLDPELQARGIKGMAHGAKGEIEVWREFDDDPESLAFESERLLARYTGKPLEQIADGFTFTASFDLTACYDSLDHGVLRYFLERLGLDLDFRQRFSEWLGKWTATDRGIYHNHGIPQGPLSSGLVSEVVLSHFDELRVKRLKFQYFRYVDDIRLFAKNENDLRRLLVELDLLSKDIGLFPQSSKICIRRIHDIENELKSVSNPPEPAVAQRSVDQRRLLKRIVALSHRFRISNNTRFKFLLAHATPSAALTARLWRILENQPEIYRSVCNYLRQYKTLPRVAASKVIEQIKASSLYQSVRAEFIGVADGRLPKELDIKLATFLKKHWAPRTLQPDLLARIGHYLVRTGRLTPSQVIYICVHARSWWTRAMLIERLREACISQSCMQNVIETGIRDSAGDVARAAGWKAFLLARLPSGRRSDWNPAGEMLLREVGMVQRTRASHCGITTSFAKLDERIPRLNWRRLFGNRYSQAERQAVETVASASTNITGFVNVLDVFNDLLLSAVFTTDGAIGGYTLGGIGSVLAPTSRFARKYPDTFALAKEVHDQRYGSMYSHPLIRHTGRPTGKIRYRFLTRAKRLLRSAFSEIAAQGLA